VFTLRIRDCAAIGSAGNEEAPTAKRPGLWSLDHFCTAMLENGGVDGRPASSLGFDHRTVFYKSRVWITDANWRARAIRRRPTPDEQNSALKFQVAPQKRDLLAEPASVGSFPSQLLGKSFRGRFGFKSTTQRQSVSDRCVVFVLDSGAVDSA
jgi:hypothetical protein